MSLNYCPTICVSLCPAGASHAAAELPSSASLVGDAGVADQRFAAGWDRGGRGFSIVLAGRWLSIVRGSSSDVNGNEAGGGVGAREWPGFLCMS